jgi:hypothetical protein
LRSCKCAYLWLARYRFGSATHLRVRCCIPHACLLLLLLLLLRLRPSLRLPGSRLHHLLCFALFLAYTRQCCCCRCCCCCCYCCSWAPC